ncbi:MAG: 50S ribosomal protein L28 [Planctomycetota bacterium]
MSRVCSITGRGTQSGGSIVRRGLPKKSGGIGLNITGRSKRKFKVNVQPKRVWVPELGEFVRVRLSTKALKDMDRKGAYKVLLDAGLLSAARIREGKRAD